MQLTADKRRQAGEAKRPAVDSASSSSSPPPSSSPSRDSRRARLTLLRRKEAWLLAALVSLALVLRLLALRLEYVITPDGVAYATLGKNLIHGNLGEGLSTYWPPLYPLLVGLASLLFRDLELAGRLVSVAAGSLLVVPAYDLIRGMYGRRVAAHGALLAAVHPLLIYYSTLLLTESTFTLFFTCGVLAGWRALSSGTRTRASALAGLAFGACYLLKPEAACFVVLLLVLTLGVGFFAKSVSFKSTLRRTLALVSGFLLAALPYLLYLRGATGEWILSDKIDSHMWQGNRQEGAASTGASLLPDATVAVVQLTRALRLEYELFNLVFPTLFVMLAALGLFRVKWTRERVARELYLLLFVAATLAGYAVTLPNIRFLVPLVPLVLCWTANGIVEGEGWLRGTLEATGAGKGARLKTGRLFRPLMVAALAASLLPLFVYLSRGDKWSDYGGQKQAALWIKEHAAKAQPRIMSTVPVAAFYAGGEHVAFRSEEDYASLVARARREHADYLIANERELHKTQLRILLDEQQSFPELTLVYKYHEPPGYKVLVYKLKAEDGR